MGNEPTNLHVEVVLAMPQRQEVKTLRLTPGSSVADAIERAGFPEHLAGYEFDPENVGIFGHKTTLETVLRDGDRVELYRPLLADPKEVRRQRALQQAEISKTDRNR